MPPRGRGNFLLPHQQSRGDARVVEAAGFVFKHAAQETRGIFSPPLLSSLSLPILEMGDSPVSGGAVSSRPPSGASGMSIILPEAGESSRFSKAASSQILG